MNFKIRPFLSFWTHLFLGSIAASLIFTCACSNEKKSVKIGVSQCSYDDWRMQLNEELYRESLLHDNLSLTILSANDDPEKQVDDIR